MKYVGLFFLFLVWTTSSLAQDEVKAVLKASSQTVQVGELFEVVVESSVNGSVDLRFPNEFQVLGRQSGGSSFSITINGRNVTPNDSKSEVKYTVRVTKSGSYTLNNGKFFYPGGSVQLNSLTIKVQDAPPVSNSLRSNLSKPFFGLILPNRTEVYVGEPVTISSKVYAKARIANVSNYEPHKIEGLAYKTDLFKQLDNLQVKNEQVEGINFQTIKLSEDLVIPQEAGEISISPFQIQLGYQGNFIFTDYANITSGSAKIRVLPLPAGKPSSFQGAVGKYNVKGAINTNELKEGEIFVFTLTIEGKGNLHLISTPELELPEGLEQYGDPKKNEKISLTSSGGEGKIEFEYTIQAQEKGIYSIKPIEFAYFDPQEKKYKTTDIGSFELKVLKGELTTTEETTLTKDAQIKAKGLRYWHEQPHPIDGDFFFGSFLFWTLLSITLLGGTGLGIFLRHRQTHASEIQFHQKQRLAFRVFQQKLKQANGLLTNGQSKEYATRAQLATLQYLSDKSGMLSTELTKEKIKTLFANHSISEEQVQRYFKLAEELEYIQFAGGAARAELSGQLENLIQVIDTTWK
jgi:hypothetical protein